MWTFHLSCAPATIGKIQIMTIRPAVRAFRSCGKNGAGNADAKREWNRCVLAGGTSQSAMFCTRYAPAAKHGRV
jgi:hypothetical protein